MGHGVSASERREEELRAAMREACTLIQRGAPLTALNRLTVALDKVGGR